MSARTGQATSRKLVLRGGYTVLIAGFLIAGVLPIVRGVRSAQTDIRGLQNDIATRQSRQHELQEIRKSAAEIKAQTSNLDRLLPANQDLGSFLKDLTTQFSASKMTDISYHNLPPTPLGRSMRLPIEVKGRGNYAQFSDFLVRMEGLQRLCSVGRLVIDADSDMSGGIEVQLTLFIYNSKPASQP